MLLLINCFMYLPLLVAFYVGHCLGMHCFFVIFIVLQIYLDEEERASCIALIVFLMCCYCSCCVALPDCALGWSVVLDCDIS